MGNKLGRYPIFFVVCFLYVWVAVYIHMTNTNTHDHSHGHLKLWNLGIVRELRDHLFSGNSFKGLDDSTQPVGSRSSTGTEFLNS